MTEALTQSRSDGILELTLARGKANAIDAETSRAMGDAFAAFRDDPELRVAILTGGGEKFFSAGWDLKAASEGETFESDYGVGGFAGLTEMHDLTKPVIAAVNGYAVGGGFELALSADLVVAAEHAQFWLPEPFVGVIADAGCFRLPRRLPRAVAMEMLMTGRRMDAAEAMHYGLVNAVVPADQLMDRAREMATDIKGAAPLSIAATKEIVRETETLTIEECYALMKGGTLETYKAMLESEDAKEGPRAFAEKRDPVWQGR